MPTITARPAPLPNRLLRVSQVCQVLSISRGTLWNIRCRDASFPKAVRISEGLIGFHEAEVSAWIASRPLAEDLLHTDEAPAPPAPVVEEEEEDDPPAPVPPKRSRTAKPKPKPKPAPGATLHGHTRPPLDANGNLIGNPIKCVDNEAIAARRAKACEQER